MAATLLLHKSALARTMLLASAACLFAYASGFRTAIEWDIIDIAIGRNLLSGNGFVDFPGAPAAVWRNPLTPLASGLLGIAAPDPYLLFRMIYTAFLTGAVFVTFLWAEKAYGVKTAAIASLLFMASPAVLLHLTGVIGTKNTMTHAVYLFFAASATYLALLAAERGARSHYCGAGALLGFAYLARTDGLFLFAAVLCWFAFLKLGFRRVTVVPIGAVGLCVLAFLAVATPWSVFLKYHTNSLQVNGQALYAFYASEGWIRSLPGDTEDAGFRLATKLYGTPKENNYSIASAIRRNPSAFVERLETNLATYLKRLFAEDFVPGIFIPFIVLGLASCLASRQPASILLVLTLFCNLVYLAFQPDQRYLTHSVPPIAVLAALGIIWPLDQVGVLLARLRLAATVPVLAIQSLLVLALLGTSARTVARSWHSQGIPEAHERRLGEAIKAVAARRGIRNPIVQFIGPAFGFAPLVAFHAHARFSWDLHHDPDGYPRDTAFSMISYSSHDLVVMHEDPYYRTVLPEDATPADEYKDPDGGTFFILDGKSARLPVVLREVRPTSTDKVSCRAGGLLRDGKGDFISQVSLPRARQSFVIAGIEIARETPPGIWQSKGPHFALGVAESLDGPLLNAPGGDLAINVGASAAKDFWLYACDDLPGLQDASYIARVYLAGGAALESSVFRRQESAR